MQSAPDTTADAATAEGRLAAHTCAAHPRVLFGVMQALTGTDAGGALPPLRTLLLLDPVLGLTALRLLAGSQGLAHSAHLDFARLDRARMPLLSTLVLGQALSSLGGAPGAAEQDAALYRHVATAALSRALAAAHAYPNLDEAWLAGLLTGLPAPLRCGQALLRFPLRGFLPDVLRYQDESAERLRDAAPLVRLAIAAHRLTASPDGRRADALPADGVFLCNPIPAEQLKTMLHDAQHQAEQLIESVPPLPAQALARQAADFARMLGHAQPPAHGLQAIADLAASLAAVDGLYDPLYLAFNTRASRLDAQALDDHEAAPSLSLRVEGSHTAAVRALFTRHCVVAFGDDPDTTLLDLQLIRQARADGLAAIPVGQDEARGVLLVCGDRDALENLAARPEYYARLGQASAPSPTRPVLETPPRVEAPPAARTGPAPESAARHDVGASGEGDAWQGRIRRAGHEINNPLGIIKNYLAILKVKLGGDSPVGDEIRVINEELERIARIVRHMADDDDARPEGPELTDINALIDDLVKVAAPGWQDRGVRIDTALASDLPWLPHPRDNLKQIVLNLLLNALEATPEGGSVRLETALALNQRREEFIEITVADTGKGISAERGRQLFEPVRSDKPDTDKAHAGLGLSIVKTLIEDLNGSLSLKSNNAGTTFQISLPLVLNAGVNNTKNT